MHTKDISDKLSPELLAGAKVGTKLVFQLLMKREQKIYGELVGIDANRLLIVKPTVFPAAISYSQIEAGALSAIHLVVDNGEKVCLAFRSEVVTSMTYPSKFIFFKFPEQVTGRFASSRN
ncbi:hypothetical protein DXX93_18950 [Thalassotalea euphylliae]|uniref:Uncharacterized protein n=1 Tax=Thalassotalea euphylliae TaxID=1655234 RepID=A0A3E0TV17_9GAMM|nr:hypothetical protein [Thalassotalea euphylliae]REL28438.1 hypothetical protein DXX93_18950 [Thalassotalea euphylliae]